MTSAYKQTVEDIRRQQKRKNEKNREKVYFTHLSRSDRHTIAYVLVKRENNIYRERDRYIKRDSYSCAYNNNLFQLTFYRLIFLQIKTNDF